jgi:hypothetical protein
MQYRAVSRNGEGIALSHPFLIPTVHDHNAAETQVIRRHGGIKTLGSRRPTAVKDE